MGESVRDIMIAWLMDHGFSGLTRMDIPFGPKGNCICYFEGRHYLHSIGEEHGKVFMGCPLEPDMNPRDCKPIEFPVDRPPGIEGDIE